MKLLVGCKGLVILVFLHSLMLWGYTTLLLFSFYLTSTLKADEAISLGSSNIPLSLCNAVSLNHKSISCLFLLREK